MPARRCCMEHIFKHSMMSTMSCARAAIAASISLFGLFAVPAMAQRTNENAVTAAADAFGVTVGDERIGVYTSDNVRGFSPITAGNRRLEGLYIDTTGPALGNRLVASSTIRVGLAALSYGFPAPSGIVDYSLRPAGDDTVLSLVAGLPFYGGKTIEIDAQLPIVPGQMSVEAGIGYMRNRWADGRNTRDFTTAVIPRLKFDGGALTTFWAYSNSQGGIGPLMATSGPNLLPRFKAGRFEGQDWANRLQRTHSYGAIGQLDIAPDWRLTAGAFEARSTRYPTFTDLFLNVQRDGTATNVVLSDPIAPARWTSGEARLAWTPRSTVLAHQFELSVRGRDKAVEGGGSGSATLGPARIGVANPAPEPTFVFGPTTLNAVKQGSLGLSYIGRWNRFAELNASVQTTRYRQRVMRAAVVSTTRTDAILYNASLAIQPFSWLTLYGGRTVGLEETGVPPPTAANRDDVLPASKTGQWDAGARITIGNTRVIAGVFETKRPYFAPDANNVYGELGQRRNRGIELSVVAQPLTGLRAIAGVIVSDPKVRGPAVSLGRTGERPLGSSRLIARLDLDYAVPGVPGLSAQAAAVRTGRTVASTVPYAELGGDQLHLPGTTTFDLGVRYRWTNGRIPMAIRVNLQDISNAQTFRVVGANTFTLSGVRRFGLQLSADL